MRARCISKNMYECLECDVPAPGATVKSNTDSFWSKLASIPIVHDGLDKVHAYANANAIGHYAIKQAEATLNIASAQMASTTYVKTYLRKAGSLGCRSLEMIERRFPVVCQPTEDLVDAVKHSPQWVYRDVRGHLQSHLLTATLPVYQSFHRALDRVELLIDRWLPPHDACDDAPTIVTTKEENPAKDNIVAQTRLYRLANRVSRRIIQRMPHTQTDLARLTETSRLVQETTQHITRLSDALQAWVTYSRSRAVQVQGQVKSGLLSTRNTANDRLSELSLEMIARLDAAASYLRNSPLPAIVRQRLAPLVQFASHEYNVIRTEAMNAGLVPLEKASHILHMTQARVLPMLHESMEGIQEQLRCYTVYAHASRDKVVNSLIFQLHSFGIPV